MRRAIAVFVVSVATVAISTWVPTFARDVQGGGAQPAAPARRAPTADISGTWTASIETGIGPMQYTYEFVLKGNILTGHSVSDVMGESELTKGSVDGPDVTFEENSALRIIYTGTIVSKDEIKFSRVVGEFGTEEFVARRKPAQK